MIKPIGNNIIVRLEKLESDSGIILDAVTGVEPIANVLQVGTGEDIPVSIGDRIAFDPSGLYQLKLEGEEYSMLSAKAIIAILDKKAKPIISGAGKL